ncbi:diguanylate cyclase [Thalassoglobus sp. JC818]|uniref:sensor domain-containing diguanylate cyclase/phosphohydrolase n=1 Tax=Thalassoglobus sp. JC818 TaxID=3232136 RepID=UPI00345AE2A6
MNSSLLLESVLQLSKASQLPTPPNELDDIISIHVLRRLLAAIHFRDVRVLKHSRRVGLLAVGIGSRLGWEDMQLRLIEIAALLHDIGKLGVPDHILGKPGKLSPDEYEYIAGFNRVAVEVLQCCQVNPDVIDIVAQSHGVNIDGTSTQDKPASLGARILAVADAYESLTSVQPYRPAFDTNKALRTLEEQAGKGFDRNVVAALERWLHSERASVLSDTDAENASIAANAPADNNAKMAASRFCHVFQYLHTLESLYDAFYMIDRDQRIVMWNMGAVKMFGYSPGELIGQTWHRSIVSSTKAKPDPVDRCLEESIPVCHRLNLKDVDGNSQSFDVQTLPVTNDSGAVRAVMELICDGNESKRHRGQFRKLQMAATRDALTGAFNRGELEQRLTQAFQQWEKDPQIPYSVVFVDLDHFKAINDRLSHAVGDRVLIDVARLIQDELYSGEQVGRYGGEEFVILCPETPLEVAIERSERLRRSISSAEIAGRDDLRVTASFGVAQVEMGDTFESVTKRADQALYDAKNSGRNRTCYQVTEHWAESQKKSELGEDAYVHQAEIVACVARGMLPMKLKGYVEDIHAKILSVKEEEITLQVGAPTLFRKWGKEDDKQPVRVRVEIHDIPAHEQKQGTRRLRLKTFTEPVGKPSSPEVFHKRANRVNESLRAYLIAD